MGKDYKHGNLTGEITVDGEGSTWTNSDRLYIGCWGSGVLTSNGGELAGYTVLSVGVVPEPSLFAGLLARGVSKS